MLGLFGLTRSKTVSERLKSLDSIAFELQVQALYEKIGYKVKQTPKSGDHGIDLILTSINPTGTLEKSVVQCKHYPERAVGESTIRELWGVVTNDHSISKGILVTSGRFSPESIRFASDKRLELIDGVKLQKLLHDRRVDIL